MKLLYVTSQSGRRINGFMRSAIIAARQLNIDFTIVSNMDHADKQLYEEDCRTYGIKAEHIDCDRNPLAKKNYTLAKKQLLDLMKREKYDVVHCNTPIGGVLGRICANKLVNDCTAESAFRFISQPLGYFLSEEFCFSKDFHKYLQTKRECVIVQRIKSLCDNAPSSLKSFSSFSFPSVVRPFIHLHNLIEYRKGKYQYCQHPHRLIPLSMGFRPSRRRTIPPIQ